MLFSPTVAIIYTLSWLKWTSNKARQKSLVSHSMTGQGRQAKPSV